MLKLITGNSIKVIPDKLEVFLFQKEGKSTIITSEKKKNSKTEKFVENNTKTS